jgi:hypothetical protein
MMKLKCNKCGKILEAIPGYESAGWRHCPCGGVATDFRHELDTTEHKQRPDRAGRVGNEDRKRTESRD